MKQLRFWGVALSVVLFMGMTMSSCSKNVYYQLCKTTSENVTSQKEGMVYEDANCKIVYNLWRDGGDAGFLFQNKTKEIVYLELDKSFFIKNGVAYDYFLNRSFSNGSMNSYSEMSTNSVTAIPTFGASNTAVLSTLGMADINQLGKSNSKKRAASVSKSVTFNEKAVIAIPAGSSKLISEYLINKDIYRSCSYLLFPSSRHISSVTFNNDNTPVSFSNFITYRIGDNGEVKHIENKFYVSQITNISDKKELVKSKEKDCNGLVSKQMYMKDYSSSSFYISYPFSKYRGMKY